MSFSTEIYGDVAVIRLGDELTGENICRLEAQLEQPREEDICNFVIDMEKTEVIDNAGLESFEDMMDQFRDSVGQVKYSGLSPTMRKIFEITRLSQRVEIYDSLIDAVRSFQ